MFLYGTAGKEGRGSATGFEQWGGYRESRKQKHKEQYASGEGAPAELIFSGVTIYINGYTEPPRDELIKMVTSRGGHYEHWLVRRRVTHVIASNLNHSKMNNIRSLKVVSPKWVTDSIEQGKLLSHIPYLLYQSSSASSFFKTADQTNNSTCFDTHKNTSTVTSSFANTTDDTNNSTCIDRSTHHNTSCTVTSNSDVTVDKSTSNSLYTEETSLITNKTAGGNLSHTDYGTDDLYDSNMTEQPSTTCSLLPDKTITGDQSNIAIGAATTSENADILQQNQNLHEKRMLHENSMQDNSLHTFNRAISNKPFTHDHNNHPILSPLTNLNYNDRGNTTSFESVSSLTIDSSDSDKTSPSITPDTSPTLNNNEQKSNHSLLSPVLNNSKTSPSSTLPNTNNNEQNRNHSLLSPVSNNSKTSPTSSTLPNTNNPNFISDFYNQSRLHHLSTWKTEFSAFVKKLQEEKSGNFPGRVRLEGLMSEDDGMDGGCITAGERVIMHVDMDCYFVSVGLRDRPHLQGKAVAVTHSKGQASHQSSTDTGGGSDGVRSFSEIASCSYEARQAGLRNGMMMGTALDLCPHLITLPYEFDKYREISQQLYNIVASYTHDIEAGSCDEMLVDLTDLLSEIPVSPLTFATQLRDDIYKATSCHASAGIGPNILVAKLATRRAKPNGQWRVRRDEVDEFMSGQLVSDLPGVGRAMKHKLESLNVLTCVDLRQFSLAHLRGEFGQKHGETLYKQCRGDDAREIVRDRLRKSVSAEINYGIRFTQMSDARTFLEGLCGEVSRRLQSAQVKGRLVCIKLMVRRVDAPQEAPKFMGHGRCTNVSKSTTLPIATDDPLLLTNECMHLLRQLASDVTDLRGVGVQISKLESNIVSQNKGGNQSILSFVTKKPNTKPLPSEVVSDDNTEISRTTSLPPLPSLSNLPLFPNLPSLSPPSEMTSPLGAMATPYINNTSPDVTTSSCDTMATSLINTTPLITMTTSHIPMTTTPHISNTHTLVTSPLCVLTSPPPSDRDTQLSCLPSPSEVDPGVLNELPASIRNEVDATLRIVTSMNCYDLCPLLLQVDPGVLNELPDFIRNEVDATLRYAKHQRQQQSNTGNKISPSKAPRTLMDMLTVQIDTAQHDTVTALPSPSQVDQACFDALPPELQEELRKEYATQNQRKLTNIKTRSSSLIKAERKENSPRKNPSPKAFKVPSSDNVVKKRKRSPKKLDFTKQPTLKKVVERKIRVVPSTVDLNTINPTDVINISDDDLTPPDPSPMHDTTALDHTNHDKQNDDVHPNHDEHTDGVDSTDDTKNDVDEGCEMTLDDIKSVLSQAISLAHGESGEPRSQIPNGSVCIRCSSTNVRFSSPHSITVA